MQIRAFRGSRTVMSLRLCSRAPCTTSSSAAIWAPLYRANVCSHSPFGQVHRWVEWICRRHGNRSPYRHRDPRRRRDHRRSRSRSGSCGSSSRCSSSRSSSPPRCARASTGLHGTGSRDRPASPSITSRCSGRSRSAIAFATPRALDQVNHALSPSGKAEIAREAKQSTGIKHDVLTARPEATEAPAEALRAREAGDADRPQGVRGRDRDLLHARRRCLLDLRARQDGRRRLLADPATEAKARARHVDADRPAARRVRTRPGAPDHARSGSRSHCSSGRSASRTGSWSARSPAWSRSSP